MRQVNLGQDRFALRGNRPDSCGSQDRNCEDF
jgi:hypothetical protein